MSIRILVLVLVLLAACNKYGSGSVDFSADATIIKSKLHEEVFYPDSEY